MWNRAFRAAPLAFALLCVFHQTGTAASSVQEAAALFLKEARIPISSQHLLLSKITADEKAPCIAETGGVTYSLAVSKAPADKEADMQVDLETSTHERNSMRARRNLVVYIARKNFDMKRYIYDDTLGGVLDSGFGRSGISGTQSVSDIVNGIACSLVWITAKDASVALASPPPEDELRDNYCDLLYDTAKRAFESGRYGDALPLFKHIHDLRWANIGMYLDASECFLRVKDKDESKKLLTELIDTLGEDMSSLELSRAGGLLRESGDRAGALAAFKSARERFREGK